MEKIGQIICTYRKLNGISQEELAGIVGVSAGAVSNGKEIFRLIGVIAETLQNVQGNVDDISEAQRKMLNIINDINVKQ